jgi:hypothetical protein
VEDEMKIKSLFLLFLFLWVANANGYQSFTFGEIEKDLLYENLKYEKGFLYGSIVNKSNEHKKDIRVRFDAYDVFDKMIWQTSVSISFLKANAKHNFKNAILSQNPESPLKIKVINLDKAKRLDANVDDKFFMNSKVLPIQMNGTGIKMSEMFKLDSGLVKVAFSHNGEEHFSIWLKDSDGKRIKLIVNEIGNVRGSSSVSIQKSGSYFVDVSADQNANWSITLEKIDRIQNRPIIDGSSRSYTDEDNIKIRKGKDGVIHLEISE